MKDDRRGPRLVAFLAAAAAVAVAVVLILTLGGGAGGERGVATRPAEAKPRGPAARFDQGARARRAPRPAPAADTPAPPAHSEAPRCRTVGCRDSRTAARRFLAAYERYSAGVLDGATRRMLAGTATPELARRLVAQPVRVPRGVRVPEAHLVELAIVSLERARARATALLRRASVVSPIELELRRGGAGWRVAKVRG